MQKKVIKTDLGLIQDIESEFQNAFKLYDVQSELIKAQNQVKKAKSDFLSTLNKAKDGLKKANDLGAESLSRPFAARVSEIKGAIGRCDKLIVAIDKAISAV
jgi:hypothetical protein